MIVFLSAPEHTRAQGNRIYYQELLQNASHSKQDNSDKDKLTDPKSFLALKKFDSMKIKNQRPADYLEEREAYEALCRTKETRVMINIR